MNVAKTQVLGTAVGTDYSVSAYTSAGFALAGGGTNFSLSDEAYAVIPGQPHRVARMRAR